MKKKQKALLALLLATGLMSLPAASQAVDFKVKGTFDITFETSNVAPRGVNKADTFAAFQRWRLQMDAVASENLSGSVMITVGSGSNGISWGKGADGGAMGADGSSALGVRHAYLDWIVPETDIKVRMGIQPILLPGFVTNWNAVYGQYCPAILTSVPLVSTGDTTVAASFYWARPYNDNSDLTKYGRNEQGYLDNIDVFALTLPVTGPNFKVSPWVQYAMIGKNGLRGINPATGPRESAFYAPRGGLMPILGSGLGYSATFEGANLVQSDRPYGDGIWAGVTSQFNWDPWELALEFTYGSVDMGKVKNYTQFNPGAAGRTFDLRRSGWYAAMRLDYKCDWGTPGVIAWYGPGDDSNPYNGSERLPQFNTPWPVSPLGFGGGYFDLNTWKVLGHNPSGLAGVVAHLKDVSFIEDLRHTLKVGYYHGTNNKHMPRNANMTKYPTKSADGPMAYLTTTDYAWEASLSNTYAIYENLEMNVEGAYVNLHLDGDTWNGLESSQYRDNWRVSVTFRYKF